jgi:hypothetical protein
MYVYKIQIHYNESGKKLISQWGKYDLFWHDPKI